MCSKKSKPSRTYTTEFLANREAVRQSMPRTPFEKFERKRFLHHSRDLGQISINQALLTQLIDDDCARIHEQMGQDLVEHYVRV